MKPKELRVMELFKWRTYVAESELDDSQRYHARKLAEEGKLVSEPGAWSGEIIYRRAPNRRDKINQIKRAINLELLMQKVNWDKVIALAEKGKQL